MACARPNTLGPGMWKDDLLPERFIFYESLACIARMNPNLTVDLPPDPTEVRMSDPGVKFESIAGIQLGLRNP